MEERFLYHIWDGGHFLPDPVSVSGKEIRILHTGMFNTNRGPDFVNAIVDIGGHTVTGDVEVHLNTYDWIAHAHHEDPYYNNVILHVVFRHGSGHELTIKENGETAEILELGKILSDDIHKLWTSHQDAGKATLPKFCDLLSGIGKDRLLSIVNYWGIERFKSKVRRYNAALLISDFDQVLYEGLMEALGYDKNKLNMLKLAQALPYAKLREWHKQGLDALDLISIYSAASGILERSAKYLKEPLYQMLTARYEEQGYYAAKLDVDWQLFRIRPGNHPIYRLFSIAPLLIRSIDEGLMKYCIDRMNLVPQEPAAQIKQLGVIFHESCLPGAEALPQPGSGLMKTLYLNIWLPISYMYYEKMGDQEQMLSIMSCYKQMGALPENHILRYMQRQINPTLRREVGTLAIFQQGLLELFARYCKYHCCKECSLQHKT